MPDNSLDISCTIQVSEPIADMFENIVDPVKMSNYFIEKGSGRMESDQQLSWKFPEFADEAAVRVDKVQSPGLISFFWKNGDNEMRVEITLEAVDDGNGTLVKVTEKCVQGEAEIKWLKGNTEGWANFLACLKAYSEYGINLRNGAFDFMRKK